MTDQSDHPDEPTKQASDEPAEAPTQSQPPAGDDRRLRRPKGDRVFAGVAGGLGAHFSVDPVIFRIVFAALTLVGGLGVVLYLAGALFVPSEGEDASRFETSRTAAILGGGGLALLALISVAGSGPPFGPVLGLLLCGALIYAAYRAVRQARAEGRPGALRVLAWMGVGAGMLVGLFALMVVSTIVSGTGGGAVIAGIVIVLGVALAVVAALGHARRAGWIVLPALALAFPLGIVSAADISLDGGVGERTYRPAAAASLPKEYHLGVGGLEVDLRRVALRRSTQTRLDVGVGVGYALVRVPKGVCVRTEVRIGGGAFGVGDGWRGGLDVRERVSPVATDAPELILSGDIGLGALEVVVGDEPPRDDRGERGSAGFATGQDPLPATGRTDPEAPCVASA